jgi:hypothetical protein
MHLAGLRKIDFTCRHSINRVALMAQAEWARVAREIVQEIQARKIEQSVRLSPYQLLKRSSAESEPDQFRSREYWVLAQQGDPACRAFRDAGLVLNFEPDEAGGREVQFVTFRLDRHTR